MESAGGWKSWSGVILASMVLHGLILGSALWWSGDAPPPRKVVTVEAICLTSGSGHTGGGATRVSAEKSQVIPQPPPKPQPVKEKPKPRVKPRPVPKAEEPPPPTLAMPRPAAPAPVRSSPAAAVSGGSGSDRGQGAGSGRGSGRGTGPGTGTGSGSGPGTVPGPGSGAADAFKTYLAEVRSLLEKQKTYPLTARRQHREGVVVLKFTIGQGGEIAAHAVVRSSGHQVLDSAAAEALQKVGRFPPLPPVLGRAQLNIQVPLAFRLSEL